MSWDHIRILCMDSDVVPAPTLVEKPSQSAMVNMTNDLAGYALLL